MPEYIKDFAVPLVGFILFFIIQAKHHKNETLLALFILFVLTLTFWVNYYPNELMLFAIGVGLGIFIEIVLRALGSQQVWKYASLFGVPYWLPLAWGIGFIIITRLGIFIRTI